MAEVPLVGGPDSRGQRQEDIKTLEAEIRDLLKAQVKKQEPKPESNGQPAKMAAKQAKYKRRGSFPYVCGTCKQYSGEDMSCVLVKGPYPKGRVDPEDTCKLWVPGEALRILSQAKGKK